MNHEFNEKVNSQPQEEQQGEALFLKVHEGEKGHMHTEELSKRLESNERAIKEQMERIAEIARRSFMLSGCGEHEHFQTLKDVAAQGAAANEPAYVALHKHFN